MRLIIGKSLIPVLYTVCLEDFSFKFKEVNIKFKHLKKLKAKAFTKNNNDIKALKEPVTLLRDNYTGKIVNIIKVYQLLKE